MRWLTSLSERWGSRKVSQTYFSISLSESGEVLYRPLTGFWGDLLCSCSISRKDRRPSMAQHWTQAAVWTLPTYFSNHFEHTNKFQLIFVVCFPIFRHGVLKLWGHSAYLGALSSIHWSPAVRFSTSRKRGPSFRRTIFTSNLLY